MIARMESENCENVTFAGVGFQDGSRVVTMLGFDVARNFLIREHIDSEGTWIECFASNSEGKLF